MFALTSIHRSNQARKTAPMEKAALASIGMVYRGAFDFGQRYWRGQSMKSSSQRETTYRTIDGRD